MPELRVPRGICTNLGGHPALVREGEPWNAHDLGLRSAGAVL